MASKAQASMYLSRVARSSVSGARSVVQATGLSTSRDRAPVGREESQGKRAARVPHHCTLGSRHAPRPPLGLGPTSFPSSRGSRGPSPASQPPVSNDPMRPPQIGSRSPAQCLTGLDCTWPPPNRPTCWLVRLLHHASSSRRPVFDRSLPHNLSGPVLDTRSSLPASSCTQTLCMRLFILASHSTFDIC